MKFSITAEDKTLFLKTLVYFFSWRLGLFIIATLSAFFIPEFAKQFPYYNNILIPSNFPYWVWGFGNFDGVHYLRIAEGYISDYSQVFFPLYPLMIIGLTIKNYYLITALLISNIFLFLALFILWKLYLLDYSKNIAHKAILLLLVFPTAFYFGAIYTESLFLFLVASFFYLARNKSFLLAGICAALASATKVVGILLFPLLILEIYLTFKNKKFKLSNKEKIKSIIAILISPLGLVIYMFSLLTQFNDPFYFINAQTMVNTNRTNQFILLPQVFYRYLKIVLTSNLALQQLLNAILELGFSICTILVLILSWKKIRLSYLLFSIAVFLVPTLTGTLSSMPRYILMDFLLLPFLVIKLGKYYNLFFIISLVLEIILLAFFIRGYWIA